MMKQITVVLFILFVTGIFLHIAFTIKESQVKTDPQPLPLPAPASEVIEQDENNTILLRCEGNKWLYTTVTSEGLETWEGTAEIKFTPQRQILPEEVESDGSNGTR